jgi:hypothetical protein
MALQHFVGPWPLFSFLILYTVGMTPWTGDEPVARPLPTHRATRTQNKRTQTSMPWVGFEPTIPVFERQKQRSYSLPQKPQISLRFSGIKIILQEQFRGAEASSWLIRILRNCNMSVHWLHGQFTALQYIYNSRPFMASMPKVQKMIEQRKHRVSANLSTIQG